MKKIGLPIFSVRAIVLLLSGRCLCVFVSAHGVGPAAGKSPRASRGRCGAERHRAEECMTEDVRQHQTSPIRTASNAGGSSATTSANPVDGDRFVLIRIDGMHCHRCEQAIKKTLQRKPGVHEVEVDFASGQASVLFNPSLITV